MPIRDEIKQLPPAERGRRKAQRLAEEALPRLPIIWGMGTGQNRVMVRIESAAFDGEALALHVEARRGTWSYADEVRVINPPILVPTGRKIPNPDYGLLPDVPEEVDEFEENPEEAIRLVIEDVIRLWRSRVT